MSKGSEQAAAFGRETFDGGLKALAAVSKGAQAIAVETGDYTRKVIEDGVSAWQSIAGAKSLEKAVEIQSAYVKSSYEAFIAEASKISSLYADVAKDAYQPLEEAFAKVR